MTYHAKNNIPAEWIEKLKKCGKFKMFTDEEEEMIVGFIREYKDEYRLRDMHKIIQEKFPDMTWDMMRYRRDKIKNGRQDK